MVDKETCTLSDLTPAVIEGIVHGGDDMGNASSDHEVVEILKKENTLLRRQLMLACSPARRTMMKSLDFLLDFHLTHFYNVIKSFVSLNINICYRL